MLSKWELSIPSYDVEWDVSYRKMIQIKIIGH